MLLFPCEAASSAYRKELVDGMSVPAVTHSLIVACTRVQQGKSHMGMCGPTWTVLFMTRLSIRPGTPYLSPSAHMEAKDYTEEDHTKWAAFACQPPLTVLSPGWDLSRLMAAFSGAGNQTKMAKSAIRDCSAFCQCMHARVVSLTVSVFKNKASSARHSFLQILPPQIEARATPCATASTPRSQIQSPPLVLLHYRPTAWAVGSNVWPLILDTKLAAGYLTLAAASAFSFLLEIITAPSDHSSATTVEPHQLRGGFVSALVTD